MSIISLIPRKVKAKGSNPNSILDYTLLENFLFEEELMSIRLLDSVDKISINKAPIILFYPGCGSDILTPLIYLEKLFCNNNYFHFIFNDIDNTFDLIKTILDDVQIPFSEDNSKINFFINNKNITLEFLQGDVFELIYNIKYDIYFERTFRIMKDNHPEYEHIAYNNLNKNGVLISDSGFHNVKKLNIPKELSAYKEMVIAIKEQD